MAVYSAVMWDDKSVDWMVANLADHLEMLMVEHLADELVGSTEVPLVSNSVDKMAAA